MQFRDLVKHFKEYRMRPVLLPVELWRSFNGEVGRMVSAHPWTEIKYLDSKGGYTPEVSHIPNDVGGIYAFYIDSEILPNSGHSFLCYIGRAHVPPGNNLRARIKDYKDYADKPDKFERPKLRDLFGLWGKHIHCRYFPVNADYVIDKKKGDELINMIEAELINKLLPPYNDKIPDVEISQALKQAF